MAIVQMQKFHVLTFQKEQQNVLQALQNFQKAELLPADDGILVSENAFTSENISAQTEALENELTRVLLGKSFLESY
ncbi:MAG TPA: hypothetical protein PK061_07835, partial [Enterococcus aquimarinus]|nr:hypothetical protein [Enterococcus aquimarinus]